ncbi:MAG: hypothetical protein KGJ98_09635 [Chloroflexota bacterium]|nr:hypothetical protein [Chloroflexota bacterium]
MEALEIQEEFKKVVADVYVLSEDLGRAVEELLTEGTEHPLSPAEAAQILTVAVRRLKQRAERTGDDTLSGVFAGSIDEVVAKLIDARARFIESRPHKKILVEHNGIRPKPVEPMPHFHGRDVPMYSGYVETTDIDLWEDNARLDIQVKQFKRIHGRSPDPSEVLSLMLTQLRLPGMLQDDEFEIVTLARSIAASGVQKPPILDVDGTVLDGNRRIAACYLILNSDEYTAEEKKRAKRIFVWQLSEFATDTDRDAVVVALNFEPDYKQTWPEYVRARKIYDAWRDTLASYVVLPTEKQQQQLKKELARSFALSPESGVVNRYLKMVELANEFEDYHINGRGHDEFETKYRANEYFQYFDELQKGQRAGGVAWTLGQDDTLRNVTFDLLYDGKFRNWTLIRKLKYVTDADLIEPLVKARSQPDLDLAQEIVEDALDLARTRSYEARTLGINARLEAFIELLEQLTPRTVRDDVKPELLTRLRQSLHLVDGLIENVLADRAAEA